MKIQLKMMRIVCVCWSVPSTTALAINFRFVLFHIIILGNLIVFFFFFQMDHHVDTSLCIIEAIALRYFRELTSLTPS